MSIDRVPILVWGTLTASVANIFAIPSVSLAFFLLWLDRQTGTHFFDVVNGGKPLLWQHLFWMFGHPWVYAVVLPAMGIVSDALPTFCRRPLVGYAAVALSTMATMLLGFGVWIHHMFATGLPTLALSFFSAASMVISIPSAVAVFAWIATIWLGDRAAGFSAERDLLHRRAPALRVAGHQCVSGHRRHLLLVSQIPGPHDE